MSVVAARGGVRQQKVGYAGDNGICQGWSREGEHEMVCMAVRSAEARKQTSNVEYNSMVRRGRVPKCVVVRQQQAPARSARVYRTEFTLSPHPARPPLPQPPARTARVRPARARQSASARQMPE